MWQRFTEKARQVILRAQEEAKKMNSESVGTEHLLLGLARYEQGIVAQILHEREIWFPMIRAAVENAAPPRAEPSETEAKLSPKAKRVLEMAADESRRFRHNYIGTEHLLLALLREKASLGARILIEFGLSLEIARELVARQLYSSSTPSPIERIEKASFPEIKTDTTDIFNTLFTPDAISLLKKAAVDAAQTKQTRIGVEHLLLALLSKEVVATMQTKSSKE